MTSVAYQVLIHAGDFDPTLPATIHIIPFKAGNFWSWIFVVKLDHFILYHSYTPTKQPTKNDLPFFICLHIISISPSIPHIAFCCLLSRSEHPPATSPALWDLFRAKQWLNPTSAAISRLHLLYRTPIEEV